MEGVTLVRDLTVEVGPELDQEEGIGGSLAIELLQTVRLLRKLVLDLPDINRLGGKRLINMFILNVNVSFLPLIADLNKILSCRCGQTSVSGKSPGLTGDPQRRSVL